MWSRSEILNIGTENRLLAAKSLFLTAAIGYDCKKTQREWMNKFFLLLLSRVLQGKNQRCPRNLRTTLKRLELQLWLILELQVLNWTHSDWTYFSHFPEQMGSAVLSHSVSVGWYVSPCSCVWQILHCRAGQWDADWDAESISSREQYNPENGVWFVKHCD